MTIKFVVSWATQENPDQVFIPVDDEHYTDTVEEAKEAGRNFVPALKTTSLLPVGVVELTEFRLEEMLTGDKPVHEFGHSNGEDTIEFLLLTV